MSTIQGMNRVHILLLLFGLAAISLASDPPRPSAPRGWLYLQANLLPDDRVKETLTTLERVAAEGYTGVVLTDYKFMRWDDVPDRYLKNCRTIRETCSRLKLKLVAGVMPIGYSNSLLSRDPNLAEGLPVRNAPFAVTNGMLVPSEPTPLINGGFETFRGDSPTGWRFVDEPGRISFIDLTTRREGRASLRMQDVARYEPDHRHARVCQTLHLRPFAAYHVSVSVKTLDWQADETRITVIGANGTMLNFNTPVIERTRDWTRIDIVFNTLDSSEVNLYLGTWAGQTGAIWWDDVRVEPAGFMNVLRREGTPLQITSEDGATVYKEGRDFTEIRDPKLGMDPWAGDYTAWHDVPAVRIPAGSRLKDGQRVLASYYHAAIIYSGQLACCMSEPKVYDILEWQVKQVRDALQPDGYLMMHDEIRTQGWDDSCARSNLTPGRILAGHIKRCLAILHRTDPGKSIYVWSDMFDPNHNAQKSGNYYLVKGQGPWYGSWEGLPPAVTIMNWQMGPKTRRATLEHFAKRGHRQILCGYYDGDPRMITGWLKDAEGLPGIEGAMYTTWRGNYSHTQAFMDALRRRNE